MKRTQKEPIIKTAISSLALPFLLCLLLCCLLSCQKKMLPLAEADKSADAPEYTIKADVNTPGGVEN